MPIFHLLEHAIYASYKKHDYLLHQNDEMQYVIYLLEGSIRMATTDRNGFEQNCSRFHSHDQLLPLIGVGEYFINNGIIPCDVIAETDCRCYLIPVTNLHEQLLENPDVLFSLYLRMTNVVYHSNRFYQFRRNRRADSMISNLLLTYSHRVNGELIFTGKNPNQIISQVLGFHPVTTSKLLSALKTLDIISQEKDGIHIKNELQLQRYVDGEDTLNYRNRESTSK